MGTSLNDELVALLRDEESMKMLATTDADGSPHAVLKQSLTVGENGNIVYLELLESSHTNKNLLRALWFGQRVAVAVRRGSKSWQVKGRPVRAHVAGPVFQRAYTRIRERLGDVDLAAVWVIEPEEVIDQSWAT
ncbi:MAG TPA: pyridoxamine 5'-phosphate oxidase family protein, partial [Anaeromyxobacteraceae bacterium]|nr:pyridoxamine 5'-phosphate oxidase family protein [Anaeromyxobacteraceae bacterium]